MTALAPPRPALLASAPIPRAALHPRARKAAALSAALDRAEAVFAVVLLFLFSEALIPLLRHSAGYTSNVQEGDPYRQAMLFCLFAVTFAFSLRRPGRIAAAALRSPLTLALVAFALVSREWSAAPEITLRRAVALAGTTLCGVWLAGRFRPRELLTLFGWALGACAVLSLLFAVALPEIGVHHDEFPGAWRGIFMQKNGLGKMMVLGALVFVLLALRSDGRRRRACGAMAALCAALVVLSTSTTSLITLAVMLAVVLVYRAVADRSRWVMPMAVGVALPATAIALAVASDVDAALGMFGKDATLTGRTELWSQAAATIGDHAWHGFGYGAFWQVSVRAQSIYSAIGWDAWHAHNGVLDLGLNLGVIGIVLFLAGYLAAVRRGSAALVGGGGREAGLWMIGYMTFMLAGNLTESSILEQNVYWIFYVATACLATNLTASPADADPSEAEAVHEAGFHRWRAVSPGVRMRARRRFAI